LSGRDICEFESSQPSQRVPRAAVFDERSDEYGMDDKTVGTCSSRVPTWPLHFGRRRARSPQ